MQYNNYNNYNDYDFNQNNYDNQPVNYVSPSNDIPIINEMSKKNESFCSIMNRRLSGLKTIAQSYQRNEYEDAVVELSYIKDLGVVNDFLRFALIKKDISKVHLKSDQVLRLFPLIIDLTSSKYEDYFRTGIQSAWVILKLFYDPILDAKSGHAMGGVDLNREEKLRKYEIIIEYFIQINNLETIHTYAKKGVKDLNLKQFIGEAEHFVKCCTGGK